MIELCVGGYHVYKDIWEAAIGELLQCERETRNTKDRYVVAVKNFARENIHSLASTMNTAKISTPRIMATVVDTV